jgi:hypothetical protein
MRDPRYTITREWCGYRRPRHVVRFCGDWIAQTEDLEHAEFIASSRDKARMLSSEQCAVLFRSWFNDFLTVTRFAEYYEFTLDDAAKVIEYGRVSHEDGVTL